MKEIPEKGQVNKHLPRAVRSKAQTEKAWIIASARYSSQSSSAEKNALHKIHLRRSNRERGASKTPRFTPSASPGKKLRPRRTSAQPHLDDVVALGVAEVPAGDLGRQVPAVEGRGGELDAAAVQHHARHGRQREPFQPERPEPVVPGGGGGVKLWFGRWAARLKRKGVLLE